MLYLLLYDGYFETSQVDTSLLHPGVTVYYRLLASELPKTPHKLWPRRIIKVLKDVKLLHVDILESGYNGLQEYIWFEQVGAIKTGE